MKQPLAVENGTGMKFVTIFVVLFSMSFSPVMVKGEEQVFPVLGPLYQEVTDVRGYKALVLVPTNLGESVNGKLPAILFLHGISERGDDLSIVKRNAFPKTLEGDEQFPFVFIMPQCPLSTEWYYTNVDNITAMRDFLDDILARFPIDPNRLYITGLSMGGIGSWYFAIKMPERFAALVPVAFRGDGWSPCPAKAIPVWAFHGAKDNVIPLENAQTLVDQFKSCGGSIRFDIYPTGAHDASTFSVTYNNPDLYDWLLRKKISTSTRELEKPVPEKVLLTQNFPNPFNPSTTFTFSLPEEADVELSIFDVLGKDVGKIMSRHLQPGQYHYPWEASCLTSGIYFYRLSVRTSGEKMNDIYYRWKKIVLIK
jgi:predicted esterase